MPKLFSNLTNAQKLNQLKNLLRLMLRGNISGGLDLSEVNEKLVDIGYDQATIDATIQSMLSSGELNIL